MSVSGQMEGGHVGHGAWEGAGGGGEGYIERILKRRVSVSGQMEGGHVGHGAWEGAGGGRGGTLKGY